MGMGLREVDLVKPDPIASLNTKFVDDVVRPSIYDVKA
jgi:hypothetical protein